MPRNYGIKADKPDGKFTVHSEGTITPPDWESLDGTLYIKAKAVSRI